jgi:trans-aconitate 2-methyltransferase
MRWSGSGYHRVATVQERWGIELLKSVPPGKYPKILDAGCGSGRLTAHLMRRFPGATVVGIDRSPEMLEQAARTLRRFERRLRLVRGDLVSARPGKNFQLIFSNATFHWVLDHPRLFQNLHDWLAPGGCLVAQCGGEGNLRRSEVLTSVLSKKVEFRKYFEGYSRPVNYASPADTERHLADAGLQEIQAWTHAAPTPFPSRPAFKDFISNVILLPNLSRLPEAALKEAYLEAFLDVYERGYGRAYMLDYVRLNILAKKPPDPKNL